MALCPHAGVTPPALDQHYSTPPETGKSSSRRLHPYAELRAFHEEIDGHRLTPAQGAVAGAIMLYANKHGGAWPSQESIARIAHCCVRTVRNALKALVAFGVLAREVPALKLRRVRHATTVYRFLVGRFATIDRAPTGPLPPLAESSPEIAAVAGRLAALAARAEEPPPPTLELLPIELVLNFVGGVEVGVEEEKPQEIQELVYVTADEPAREEKSTEARPSRPRVVPVWPLSITGKGCRIRKTEESQTGARTHARGSALNDAMASLARCGPLPATYTAIMARVAALARRR